MHTLIYADDEVRNQKFEWGSGAPSSNQQQHDNNTQHASTTHAHNNNNNSNKVKTRKRTPGTGLRGRVLSPGAEARWCTSSIPAIPTLIKKERKSERTNAQRGKTSTSSTTANNWNVNVLLRNPLQRGEGYDRRHFNQLFHQLRLANRSSQRDVHGQDLGHLNSLLRIR